MATKNLIPRGDGEGGIGKPTVAWGSGVFKTGVFESALTISGVPVLTGQGFLTQDSDGNVGIGTTSPGAKLHINQEDANGYATNLFTTTTESFSIGVGGTSAPEAGLRDKFYIYDNASSGGAARLVINSAGNVGIGTTSPDYALHVEGGGYFAGESIVNIQPNEGIYLGESENSQDYHVSIIAPASKGSYIDFSDTSRDAIGRILYANPSASLKQGMHFYSDFTSNISSADMFIDSDGSVGIGTTSPATNHKLHIKNTETANIRVERSKVGHTNSQNGYVQIAAAEGSNLIYSKDLDGNDKDFVIDAGNVGIGTATPNAKLAIDGDLKIGEARINSENDRVVFDSVPAALDSIGNPQTFLTAEKLGLGTIENLAITSQDIEFKLLTDENRFVVGTTGEGGLASGWYRFNDFNVKGATDVGAISLNPVDTRIYSDEDSFVYMTRDAYGNRVAHLVGGDETPNPANNIALGLAIKIDSSDTPEDIEFTHTDGEQYSLVNGDSDSKGVNGLPIRQGFQAASIGAYVQPLLIDGGYF